VRPDQLERRLRERLDALGPAPRAELLHVPMLPDFKRHNLLADKPPKKRGETRGDVAPEEQVQQAMRAILLIPAAVAVILAVLYLLTRRDEETGHGWRILDALSDLLSWWSWWR
jgi:hypothetical protein